ncbi:MAG: hypothetical protein AAGF07_03850 [Patescibacteria group bacterium]
MTKHLFLIAKLLIPSKVIIKANSIKSIQMWNRKIGIYFTLLCILIVILIAQQIISPTVDTHNIPILLTILFAFVISAGTNLYLSLNSQYSRLEKEINKNTNKYRWKEFSLSSSLMVLVLAQLLGIYDISTLILLFTCHFTAVLLSADVESSYPNKKKLIAPLVTSIILYTSVWLILLGRSRQFDSASILSVSNLAYLTYILFCIYPALFVLQFTKKFKEYYGIVERIFSLWSFISKMIFVIFVVAIL